FPFLVQLDGEHRPVDVGALQPAGVAVARVGDVAVERVDVEVQQRLADLLDLDTARLLDGQLQRQRHRTATWRQVGRLLAEALDVPALIVGGRAEILVAELRRGVPLGRRHDALGGGRAQLFDEAAFGRDRKSTRLNSSHVKISYAVFCLKKKTKNPTMRSGQIMIRCIVARVHLLRNADSNKVIEMLSPLESSAARSELETALRGEVALSL